MSSIPVPGTSAEQACADDARLLAMFAGNPVVDAAEQALRSFDDDMGREMAEALLASWKHTPELSVREIRAILARFSVAGPR